MPITISPDIMPSAMAKKPPAHLLLSFYRIRDLHVRCCGRRVGGWEGILEEIGPVFKYIHAFSLASHQAR
jgi:hypothetical protein